MGTQGARESRRRDLVLDTGALIAYERGDRNARALVKVGAATNQVIVPASVLAQAWRGGPRGAALARLIEASTIDPLDEGRAKEVGVRLGARSAHDITDAHVVCCALERSARVVTSDPDDIAALAAPDEPLVLTSV